MKKKKEQRSSQQEFEKYFSGEMSPKESQELESKALGDAFEYEAMEGWESAPLTETQSSLEDIRKGLDTNLKHRKLTLWKIAAAISLLLVSGALVYLSIQSSNNETLALADEPILTEEKKLEVEAPQKVVGDVDLTVIESQKPEAVTNAVVSNDDQPTTIDELVVINEEIVLEEEIVMNEIAEVSTADDELIAFSDTEGSPITAIEGPRESDTSADSEEESNASGFSARTLSLSTPASSSDVETEKEISRTQNLSKKSNNTKRAPEVFSDPKLKRGQNHFDRYISRNLVIPELARTNNIVGDVTLRVHVNEFGEVTKIETIEGLGYGCDEEAMRLVKEGPSWLSANKNGVAVPSTVEVIIRFP